MIFNLFPEEYDFEHYIDSFFNFKKKVFKYSNNTRLNIETLDFIKQEYQIRYGKLVRYDFNDIATAITLMSSNDQQSIFLGKSLITKYEMSAFVDNILLQKLFAKVEDLEIQDYIYLYITIPNIHLLKMIKTYGYNTVFTPG
jgi:hypothetical protein